MTVFSPEQEAVLNAIQSPLPFVRLPFLVLEKEIGIPEGDIIRITQELKDEGVIRSIAGIFNGSALGYKLSLVAFSVEERDIERSAAKINAHPGVSHNYLRDHKFNIWFTIAETSDEDLQRSVNALAKASNAAEHLLLKNERMIKIGFRLNFGSSGKAAPVDKRRGDNSQLTDVEKETVLLLQKDMPVVPRPFKELAAGSNLSEDELIENAAALEEKGVLRRYAGVLRHQKAGYNSNAMTAWKLNAAADEEETEAAIKYFAEEPAVTHLYLRTVYPGRWEYPLFAMIHGRSDEELNGIINGLEEKSGLRDKLVLRSLKEFKKQRVIYFSPEFNKWKEQNYD